MARGTCLHGVHEALGASFTVRDGWELPLRYGSGSTELGALRSAAGILDLSHLTTLKAQGPLASAALDAALAGAASADPAATGTAVMGPASPLPVGLAMRARLAPGGGDAPAVTVHRLGDEEFLVVADAADRHRCAAELTRRARPQRAAIIDATEAIALIAVAGPRAEEVLRGVVESGAGMPAALLPEGGAPAPEDCGPDVLCGPGLLRRLRDGAAVRATACGHTVIVARESVGGLSDVDCLRVFCGAEDAVDLWEMIAERAACLEPGGGSKHADNPESAENAARAESSGGALPVLTACGLAAWEALGA